MEMEKFVAVGSKKDIPGRVETLDHAPLNFLKKSGGLRVIQIANFCLDKDGGRLPQGGGGKGVGWRKKMYPGQQTRDKNWF